MNKNLLYILVLMSVLGACKTSSNDLNQPIDATEEYAGGENFTTFDFSENAFGEEGKNITSTESNQFVVGNSLFRANWVTAPSSVQSLDGLGPIFNGISCGSCHFKDGRAKPPQTASEPLNGLLFRMSVGLDNIGNAIPEPNYGGQFQDKAVTTANLGVLREGGVSVSYEEISGNYADGMPYTMHKPIYNFIGLNYGAFDANMMYSPRIAQQIPGLGLLENIPESIILALSDENDSNNDGISGKANMVWNVEKQALSLGRFGWKANIPTLKQQTAGAFNGDIGITTSIFPKHDLTTNQQNMYANIPNGGNPEVDDNALEKIVNYVKMLSVPARRDFKDTEVLQGKTIFTNLKCGSCHYEKFETGNNSPIVALNNQKIRPYTDLLLHDMGAGLADNRPDYKATGTEWRTPPLWGIGLLQTVNNHTFLLHDGRARNVEEAILWHSGEAEKSKNDFKKLSSQERKNLIKFVNSL